MIIGSLTPDFGYCFERTPIPGLAHSLAGSVLFCLPVGLAAFGIFLLIREPLTETLPGPHRQALLPLCRTPLAPWWGIVLSVLVGAWTHLALDAVTRESQVLVPHLGAFRTDIVALQRKGIAFSRLPWAALSAAGLAWLVWAYARFLRQAVGSWRWLDLGEAWRGLFWAAVLLVPLAFMVHGPQGAMREWPVVLQVRHLIYHTLALYLAVMTWAIAGFGLLLRLRNTVLARPATRPPADRR
jgi:hypothetical protein